MQISLPGLLAVIFIVLKLLGVIAWSWLWVLSPIWITALIVLVIWALIAVAATFANR